MDTEDKGQSGYYQTIAREFLARRGAPFFLSPRDQSMIAVWEDKRIPLRVVLEGISRTFDGLRAKARGTKSVALAFCERQVNASFAQHRDRSAGRGKFGELRTGKRDSARQEVEKGLRALPPDDREIARLLEVALDALAAPKPDEAALERIDADIEDLLWGRATSAEKAAAETDVRKELRGRRPEGLEAIVRRKVVKAARDSRRIPHVSLFYY